VLYALYTFSLKISKFRLHDIHCPKIFANSDIHNKNDNYLHSRGRRFLDFQDYQFPATELGLDWSLTIELFGSYF
jgi:hypothetical protein